MANTLHTYSHARPFKGLNIPLPLQSTYLRHYANARGYIFSLPIVEWCIDGVFLELFQLMSKSCVKDIALTSCLMLPSPDHIDDSFFSLRENLRFPFVLENQIINSKEVKAYLQALEETKNQSAHYLYIS